MHISPKRDRFQPIPGAQYPALAKPGDARLSDNNVDAGHARRSAGCVGDLAGMIEIGNLFHRQAWSGNPIDKSRIAKVYSGFGRMKLMNLCRSCWANYEEKKDSDGEMMRHSERPERAP